jgi:hypothetical protein
LLNAGKRLRASIRVSSVIEPEPDREFRRRVHYGERE